ncbi:MAG: DUF4040 domain-containing protein [Chloroflexi bacterium]|nr:DUF4040 domain-containing protein [Chloroflexota bacterium]
MLLLTALPFAAALVLLTPLGRPKAARYALAGLSAVLFLGYAGGIPSLEAGPLIEAVQWLPSLGMTLTTYVDGLSLLFALLVTGVGAVVAFYMAHYFDDDADAQQFSVLFAAFMGSMLMVVTSGNLLMTFVGWEGTSVFSFLLIGFYGGKGGRKAEEARAGAARALIVTGAGGLALIAGVVLLGTASGSYELADILSNPDLRGHGLYGAIVALIAMAAFTKSAQFPFHFWLPGAMSAPSPASAYLHAATMVKAGVFLLLRLQPALGNTPLWTGLITVVGLITFVLGAAIATRQRDMKGLLAYTTVSALGSLVALIGLPDSIGIKAALVGVAAHGAYKAALFLMTGVIEHATGSRDLDELGGLRRSMPGALAVVAISSLSMAGLPPLLGFMAKDSLIEASFSEPLASILPLIAVMVGSVLMVVSALTVLRDAFLTEPPAPHSPAGSHDDKHHGDVHHPHTNRLLTLGPAVLAAATVLIPFTLPQTLDPLVSSALGKATHLHIFPEHPEPLILSLVALAIGIVLVPSRAVWSRWLAVPWLPTGSRVYSEMTRSVDAVGDVVVTLQSGRVRQYLYMMWGVLAVLVILMVGSQDGMTILEGVPLNFTEPGTDAVKIALLALSTAATAYSIITRRHLLAALALGVSGYALGGVFLLEPAPDVALVQILVETLGTVLIILMIARLDATNSRMRSEVMRDLWSTSWVGKLRDVIIATIIGGAVALVAVTTVINRPERADVNPPIAEWHLLHTYPEIKITDTVGAIVTDFRGTDTVFEITVLAMAGLGVLTLLTQPGINASDERVRTESTLETPLTTFALRLVFPFALLVAMSQLLYGGTGPGDGFTAGVIAGLGVSLSYVVRGFQRTRVSYPWLKPRRFIVGGLTLAVGNAVGWMLINGAPFLRVQDFGDAPAGLHFSSTLLFEIAIMLAVFGAITLIMDTIAHPVAEEEEG